MNERQVTEAVLDWAGDVCGIDPASRFAYPVAFQTAPLPTLAVIVEQKRTLMAQQAAAEFPFVAALEQVALYRLFDCTGSVMVAVEQNEADALAQFQQLQAYGADLETSALGDETLGGRVPIIGPLLTFDYSPVFGETESGVRGRLVAFTLIVGEPAA